MLWFVCLLLLSPSHAQIFEIIYINSIVCLLWRRNECFRISGVRGQYPQVFLLDDDDNNDDDGDDTENQSDNNNSNNNHTSSRRGSSLTFVGDFETVEGIHDSSNLPEEILEKYPSVVTWDKILQTK